MDVAAWLRGLGLEQYAHLFRDNDIDGEILCGMTAGDLKELGISSFGHRRRLLNAITSLAGEPPTSDVTQSATSVTSASTSRPPIDAERRQLTVMFCDLVGSTALSARLDPEDLREVIAAYHRAIDETVARFDGFVAKYMGDGVLVYFGYPRAHEDDAERAVLAGLGCIDTVARLDLKSVKLQARVGIATGLVVVGDLIGEGSAQEQTVVGETPNLAARLQSLAESNSVVIAPSTRRLVGDLFEYRVLDALKVKGIAEPVPAWQVLRRSILTSRFEALRGSALSPLVGRDEEIDLLLRRWTRAKAGGGQVVLISGEPGIGKSRLTAALQERLHDDAHIRLSCFCSPYYEESALYPFIDQLGRAAEFARDDPPAAKLEKLEALLTRAAPSDEDMALLADLLSLPNSDPNPLSNLGPQRKKERTLEALIHQLEGLAREQPVVMVFEDAHWIDPTSRELLDLIVERVVSLPVLLIVTFRPEFQPPWIGQPQVSMLTLNRLDRHDRIALVEQIVGGRALPDEVVAQIVDRADGVPLFVEELTKNVLESGLLREEGERYVLDGALPPLAIPASLHDSLIARLDRLASARHVAQIGAAIGREFSYELAAAVAHRIPAAGHRGRNAQLMDALDQLAVGSLLFRRGTPPFVSYVFKHALVQEAVYSTLLRSQRQEMHAHIAKVLEERFPEMAETEPETFARHYTEAGVLEVAVDYWQKAGARALQRSAHAEAASHLTNAIRLLKSLAPSLDRSEQELGLQIGLASALHATKGQSAVEVADAYQRAHQLCEEVDNPRQLFRVLMGLYRFYGARMQGDLAFDIVEQLYNLAQKTQDPDLLLQGHMAWGTIQLLWGDLHTAQHHLGAAITRYAPDSHRSHAVRFNLDPGVLSLSRASWALWFRGYPDQALEKDHQTLTLARELGHAQSLSMALCFSAIFRQFRREPILAQPIAQEAAEFAAEHRLPLYVAEAGFVAGWAIVQLGQFDAGFAQMRESFDLYRRLDIALDLPWYLALLAEVWSATGKIDEGLTVLDQAEEMIRTNVRRSLHLPEWHRIKGELLLAKGRWGEAERSFLLSLASASEKGARGIELRAAVSLARLRRDQGRSAEARDLLAPVYKWFTEGFDTPDLKGAKALLDELA